MSTTQASREQDRAACRAHSLTYAFLPLSASRGPAVSLLSVSSASPAKTKAQILAEKRAKLEAEQAALAAEMAREPTPSEVESLAGRIEKLTVEHDPINNKDDFELDSGISIDGTEDKGKIKKAFRELDAKYTELAVKEWLLRQAYYQKHRDAKASAAAQQQTVNKEVEKIKKEVARGKGCGCRASLCSSSICGCRRLQLPCFWAANGGPNSGCQGCSEETCMNPLSWVGKEEKLKEMQSKYAKELKAKKAAAAAAAAEEK